MGRPLYESSKDVENEREVAEAFGKATSSVLRKNPKAYSIDWCAYKPKLKAWVEIKCRKNPRNQYPTLLLSYHKITQGRHFAECSGADFILLVRWTDGIFWWRCPNDISGYTVDNGGRVDRNDAQDMEPVIHIPTQEFILLAKKEDK